MQGGAYTLKVRESGDWFTAVLGINLGGDVQFDVKARVSTSAIAALLNQEFGGTFALPGGMSGTGISCAGESDMMGWFGSKIFRKIKKVAKKVAKSKAFKTARKIFRNPMFKKLASKIPYVGAAVGALTVADRASQVATRYYKRYKKYGRKALKLGRSVARLFKKKAARSARRSGVSKATFKRAWKSGWNTVPNPRELAEIRAYRGRANVRRLYRGHQQNYRRQYNRALPSFLTQYARQQQPRGRYARR